MNLRAGPRNEACVSLNTLVRGTERLEDHKGTKGVIGVTSAGNLSEFDPRKTWSTSPARKHAAAMNAKIPLVLSRHIAKAWYPQEAA